MWGVLGDNYHSFVIYNEELNPQGNMRPTVTSLRLVDVVKVSRLFFEN